MGKILIFATIIAISLGRDIRLLRINSSDILVENFSKLL
jgi:hypothetical protein